MTSVHLILILLSLVCFLLATIGVARGTAPGAPPRPINLTSLGLFFFVLSELVK